MGNSRAIAFKQGPSVLWRLALLLLLASGLIACDSSTGTQPSVPTGTPVSVPTGTPVSVPTDTATVVSLPPAVATEIAKNTQVVTYRIHVATSVALTGAPTRTPGGPPDMPTFTPVLGIVGDCPSPNSRGFQCYNMWRGYQAGHLMEVRVGRQGWDEDPTQGEIVVLTRGTRETYFGPGKTGAFDIVSLDGDLVTVTAIESPHHETFIFNLQTHQWTAISPVPGGLPTASPLP
jgi:hypothetical protein